MIEHYEKFRIPDENKEKDFFWEVNWNANDPKSNKCKLLKVTFPNGDETLVKKEHLIALLFAIGSEEEQRKMIPQKLETVHEREVKLSFKATKDIRKGEAIILKPISISIPCENTMEFIGKIKKEKLLKATKIMY